MTFPANSRPTRRNDLVTVEIDGEAVVYDEAKGDLHHLNPSATIVLGMCDGSLTVEEMAAEVADTLDVALGETLPHVRSAVDRFVEAGLLA